MVDTTVAAASGLNADTAASRASATTGTTAGTTSDRAKIAELAREFESYFILQMLRQMRQSMLEEEDGKGLGAGTMTDTMDIELGRQLASGGGIGLAPILQTALERQVGSGSSAAAAAATSVAGAGTPLYAAPASTSPVAALDAAGTLSSSGYTATAARSAWSKAASLAAGSSEELSVPLPVAAPVSSHYGWRTDPFSGTNRFHAGVDIAAPYGREVPSAEAGQVVFAGAQGGYGNTVVIEHQGGVQTRYAHLSSIQVVPGEEVDAGSVIGRVGSTGRSTGPHLHFEVLQDGHPVNPEAAATRFAAGLKNQGADADLPLDQPSVNGVAAGVDDED
jgi:murein DD-endopeptidase MepM/ murein hydrolase activator NlpD